VSSSRIQANFPIGNPIAKLAGTSEWWHFTPRGRDSYFNFVVT